MRISCFLGPTACSNDKMTIFEVPNSAIFEKKIGHSRTHQALKVPKSKYYFLLDFWYMFPKFAQYSMLAPPKHYSNIFWPVQSVIYWHGSSVFNIFRHFLAFFSIFGAFFVIFSDIFSNFLLILSFPHIIMVHSCTVYIAETSERVVIPIFH